MRIGPKWEQINPTVLVLISKFYEYKKPTNTTQKNKIEPTLMDIQQSKTNISHILEL